MGGMYGGIISSLVFNRLEKSDDEEEGCGRTG